MVAWPGGGIIFQDIMHPVCLCSHDMFLSSSPKFPFYLILRFCGRGDQRPDQVEDILKADICPASMGIVQLLIGGKRVP